MTEKVLEGGGGEGKATGGERDGLDGKTRPQVGIGMGWRGRQGYGLEEGWAGGKTRPQVGDSMESLAVRCL